MKDRVIEVLILAIAVATFLAAPAIASDPVGVYAVIERVVFEPSEGGAQRIQVWGAFALADGMRGDGYQVPQRGYLYYTLRSEKEEICRKEWQDLKAVAGSPDGIGFGGRYVQNGRVRKASEKAENPDVYPIGFGMVRMTGQHNQSRILSDLKQAARTR